MPQPDASSGELRQPPVEPYEAPRVETILTPDELEREVLYAGTVSVSTPG